MDNEAEHLQNIIVELEQHWQQHQAHLDEANDDGHQQQGVDVIITSDEASTLTADLQYQSLHNTGTEHQHQLHYSASDIVPLPIDFDNLSSNTTESFNLDDAPSLTMEQCAHHDDGLFPQQHSVSGATHASEEIKHADDITSTSQQSSINNAPDDNTATSSRLQSYGENDETNLQQADAQRLLSEELADDEVR